MKPQQHHKIITPDTEVHEGLLFIPDISGFTELVQTTDVLTGKQITSELLSAILSQNNLKLNIAEVEGDAILFFRYGKAPNIYELMEQYELMKKAFERKLQELQIRFSQPIILSLKVIAHYGVMTEYKIGPFVKLYGKVLIEAHRLLKNAIGSDSYLLLTDSLLDITGAADNTADQLGIRSDKLCEVYGSLKNICFSYWDFKENSTEKKIA
jgi:hypothetical protein